jgi:hypothetical protein
VHTNLRANSHLCLQNATLGLGFRRPAPVWYKKDVEIKCRCTYFWPQAKVMWPEARNTLILNIVPSLSCLEICNPLIVFFFLAGLGLFWGVLAQPWNWLPVLALLTQYLPGLLWTRVCCHSHLSLNIRMIFPELSQDPCSYLSFLPSFLCFRIECKCPPLTYEGPYGPVQRSQTAGCARPSLEMKFGHLFRP